MIRPYLRHLINEHKTIDKSNDESNEENDDDDNDDGDDDDDDDTDRAEWKIKLVMQNSCISTRNFEETQTIYSASKPVEIFMGSDTEDVIDTLFNNFTNIATCTRITK